MNQIKKTEKRRRLRKQGNKCQECNAFVNVITAVPHEDGLVCKACKEKSFSVTTTTRAIALLKKRLRKATLKGNLENVALVKEALAAQA